MKKKITEAQGVTLAVEIIDAAQPGAWEKNQDPEIKEMLEEDRRREEAAQAPTLEEFLAKERVRELARRKKEAPAAGNYSGVADLVRTAPRSEILGAAQADADIDAAFPG